MENKLIALYLRLSLEDVDSRKDGTDESNSITNQRSVLMDIQALTLTDQISSE